MVVACDIYSDTLFFWPIQTYRLVIRNCISIEEILVGVYTKCYIFLVRLVHVRKKKLIMQGLYDTLYLTSMFNVLT